MKTCKHCPEPVEADRYDMCYDCWWDHDPRNVKNGGTVDLKEEQVAQEDGFATELGRLFQEFTDALQKNDINKASMSMNAMWVFFQIFATSATSELKELTYLKAPFMFDKGSQYLLTFMHVDGPKIKLKEDKGNAITKAFEEVK